MILPLANILQPLIDLADAIIKFCHDNVGLSWGLAIIALTFIVRLALLPLSLRGIRSMRRMQVVAPKLQALKEKYKDDPQRFQRETMEVYKKEGVNPFSSCLPFILQIPFFIAIYQLLRGDTFQTDVEQ
ncbi:MAG TPA: membrane protein insertase YidC, partial [Thermoleophilaceae bacterium]|nr:membrane protein insertase YidC [Thermoleophilaceae bacterium]